MKKILFLILCCALPLAAADAPAVSESRSYEYYLTVPAAEEAVNSLIAAARAQHGIVMNYSDTQVVFRVPDAAAAGMLEELKKTGYISDERLTRSDVGEQIAVLRSQLKVKQEYVKSLYALTAESDLGGTLDAEREIELVVNAVDQLKSSIKNLERRKRYADFTVYVTGPSVGGRPSSYSRWSFINRLGIEYLMSGK